MDVISTLQLRQNRRGRRLAAPLVCLALGTLVLSGCGSARQTFGLDRTPPDEFSVLTRAPLAVPPEYKLRPPAPGAPRPQESDTRQQAASAVFGSVPQNRQQAAASSAPVTSGESALLNTGFIDSLLFWQKQDPPGTVVNAKQEQQRLRENAALGKPVTEGDTPVIERRRKAPLEGLFN
jgi:hypothetical protein